MTVTSLEDFPERELVALWNGNMKEAYRITEAMFAGKVRNDKDLFLPGTRVAAEDGKPAALLVTKLSDNSLPEYQNTAWISLLLTDAPFRRRGVASRLYLEAERRLREAGVRKIIVAGEMENFYSGIPDPDAASAGFFGEMGFTLNTEHHFDLVNDVSKIDFEACRVPLCGDPDYDTRPFRFSDMPALRRFFASEFPGRWEQEVVGYLEAGGNPAFLLVMAKGDAVEGFCRVSVHHGTREASPYFGGDWGSLGPIGVAESARGRGLGNRILRDSLRYLQRIGAHNVNIDWTILRGFYGQFGFEPWRTYLGAYKEWN